MGFKWCTVVLPVMKICHYRIIFKKIIGENYIRTKLGSVHLKYEVAGYIDRYKGKTQANRKYVSSITILKCFHESLIS